MSKLLFIHLLFYLSLIWRIQCTDDSNCTFNNKKLRDCPPKLNCFDLNLSNNWISNIDSTNCYNSILLTYNLSINYNNLTSLHTTFPRLYRTDAVGNLIETVNISKSNVLRILNLANNRIRKIIFKQCNSLKELNLSNNLLEDKSFRDVFTNQNFPHIEIINLSFNKIRQLNFLDFYLDHVKLINISNNKLSHVNLNRFPSLPHHSQQYDLILSNNQISSITSNKIQSNLMFLDLSGNKITKLESQFTKFIDYSPLISMDISANPLNCNCDTNYDFINWLHKNPDKFIRKSRSFCSDKSFGSIFNILCNITSTTSSSVSTTTEKSTQKIITTPRTIIHTTTYHKTIFKRSGNLYFLFLVIPITIILLIGFVVFRNNQRGLPLFICSRETFRSSNNIQSSDDSDDRLRFLDDSFENADLPTHVTILCAPSQSNWTSTHIVPFIEMECRIITHQLVSSSPSSSDMLLSSSRYIVIFSGVTCMADQTLSNNLRILLASPSVMKTDIGLILGFMPPSNDESLKKLNFCDSSLLSFYQKRFSYRTFILTNENSMNHGVMIDKLNEWIGIPI